MILFPLQTRVPEPLSSVEVRLLLHFHFAVYFVEVVHQRWSSIFPLETGSIRSTYGVSSHTLAAWLLFETSPPRCYNMRILLCFDFIGSKWACQGGRSNYYSHRRRNPWHRLDTWTFIWVTIFSWRCLSIWRLFECLRNLQTLWNRSVYRRRVLQQVSH